MFKCNLVRLDSRLPKKRRNSGRSKNGRGHTNTVRCSNCARCVPKDKAIKRYIVRSMVESSAMRDLTENSAYEGQAEIQVPNLYIKLVYCVSCAVHSHVVRIRSKTGRRNRVPPPRLRYKGGKRVPAAAPKKDNQ